VKRTPLKRTTALKTSRKPIAAVSPKRRRANANYRKFAQSKRKGVGRCELGSPVCRYTPDGIHHVIKLSQDGALMPGAKAVAQGQIFMVSCNPCNGWVEDHPKEARERGWVKTNPRRR